MPHPREIILVATGRDRPGVMDEVATLVLRHGGEVADSRSINVGGQFALLVLIGGSDAAIAGIRAEAGQLAERAGIHVRLDDPVPSAGAGDTYPYLFSATGKNHPKVIHAISHLMRVMSINIESLQTHEEGDNGPDQRSFRMELGLAIPREVPILKLREFLDQLCGEMHVKYELAAV